jgi:four helix bundle protein
MPNTEGIAIFKKIYDLVLLVYQYVRLFPKSEKFILGERIEHASIDLLEGIITANQKKEKQAALVEASVKLDVLRIFIRLSKDLRFLDLKKYETLSNHIVEIGRMLGGWIKYEKEKLVPKENTPATVSVPLDENLPQPL